MENTRIIELVPPFFRFDRFLNYPVDRFVVIHWINLSILWYLNYAEFYVIIQKTFTERENYYELGFKAVSEIVDRFVVIHWYLHRKLSAIFQQSRHFPQKLGVVGYPLYAGVGKNYIKFPVQLI